MISELQIRVLPQTAAIGDNLKRHLADKQGWDVRTIKAVRILRRSIDARHQTLARRLLIACGTIDLTREIQILYSLGLKRI